MREQQCHTTKQQQQRLGVMHVENEGKVRARKTVPPPPLAAAAPAAAASSVCRIRSNNKLFLNTDSLLLDLVGQGDAGIKSTMGGTKKSSWR